jgi:hypothetical protein
MLIRKIFMAVIITGMTAVTAFGQYPSFPNVSVLNAPAWTSPAGSWEGVVTNLEGGPPPFRVLLNFTADGGFTGSGDGDSAVGSPQYGVWEQIGSKNSRTYSVTFRQLFYDPPSSIPTGFARIQQKVVLSKSGDSWSGPFVVRIYTPDGILVFTGTGTTTAQRIVSEPLN